MYAKHRHAWIYRSIRACHAEALAKAGPLACLVGKTFPRFGCIALRACLFSATGAGLFKPGATPQGNVAREDERCRRESATVQMNRAFSAGRGLFTGEPGALPQAHVTIAPLALSEDTSHSEGPTTAQRTLPVARAPLEPKAALVRAPATRSQSQRAIPRFSTTRAPSTRFR